MLYVCDKCNTEWRPRQDVPSICPKCKTPYSKGFIRPAEPVSTKAENTALIAKCKEALEKELHPAAGVIRALFKAPE